MILISANNIRKSYGARTVLEEATLAVHQGDKIGVVGGNGVGKSTLLGILSGEVPPDGGTVARHCTPAYIRQFDTADATRSGGENAKANILRETARGEAVLFADEPTANLDAKGQQWVREKLQRAGTLLLVSHDRALLDALCTRIVEIKEGKLHFYTGNYSAYEAAAEEKKRQNALAVEEYRRKKAQLEDAVRKKQRKAAHTAKAPSRMGNSEARLAKDKGWSKQKKAERQATVLKSRLERLEPVEREKGLPPLRMDFSLTDPPETKVILACRELDFSYGEKQVLQGASFEVPRGERVAVTGGNGAGKTTLLRLILEEHPAFRQAPKLRWGYLRQDFSQIDPSRTVLDNCLLKSVQDMASVRSALAGLLFKKDDVYKKAQVLSGGEKMRLSIAMLLTSACNALLLDEPSNYLDLHALTAVGDVLCQYPGTILFVSHDQRFVDQVATSRLVVEGGKVFLAERLAQMHRAQKVDPAQKTLLEIRAAKLLGELGSAPPARKDELEREYAGVTEQLRAFKG